MTDYGFMHQVNKLKSIYGEKTFHPDRLKVIAKSLRILTDDDFEDICADIIANSNTPPTLKDFLKAGQTVLHFRRLEQIEKDKALLEKSPRCKACDGDGFVSAIKTVGKYEYSFAFKCPDNCLAAKLFAPTNYPQWGSNYETEHKLCALVD